MAEKIIDIKLNAKEAIDQIESLDQSIVQLEDNVADATRELNKMEAELSQVNGASGKALVRRKQLNEKIAKTKAFLKQENTALKENKKQKQRLNKQNSVYNKKLKEQAKAHNEVSKGLTKTIGGTGVLDQATGGLFSKYQGLAQGLKATTSGLGKFKLALIGTGVGALVVVLGSLVAAFQASEEGQNKFTKALNQGKAIIANAVELLSQLGNGITNTFAAIGNFITGKGSLSDVGDALGDTFDTVSEKISTFSEDIKEDVKLAGELSDQLAKADKIDRKLMVERQKANAKVNELRTKAYNTEKFTAEERIKFLEEAITIEDGVTNKEIEAARLRFEAKKKENDMTSLARKEDLDEQAELEKKLFELEAKKINRQREVENQRQMLVRKRKQEEEKERAEQLKIEQDRLDSIEDIRDEYAQRELEKQAQTELAQVELEENNKLKELERLNASEEAKQQIRDYYLSVKDEARKNDKLKADENRKQEEEAEQALLDAKLSAQMQLAAASQAAIANLGALFEEGTAASKTAALADIAIGTGIGFVQALDIAQKSAKATGPAAAFAFPIFYASQIASVLGAVGQAKKILSTVKGGKGSAPSVAGSRGASSASTPSAPSFNVVGAAPENQLAQAIGQQDAQPVKAYVVSNEITNAQSLERNIINESTIG
jgi:DNA repair exonuclease SbcCD ATPase subunit